MSVVFVDLDGTLLSNDLTVSPRNIAALRRAAASGVQIVLSSGRPAASVARFAGLLPGRQLIIASNGGVTYATDCSEDIDVVAFPHQVKRVLGDVVSGLDVSLCLYAPRAWYTREINDFVRLEMDRSGTSPCLQEPEPDYPCIKALLIGSSASLRKCESRLMPHADQLYWFYTYPEYLEVMPHGSSKGRACSGLLRHLGFSSAETLALGDGENDLPMFEVAGIKVAVANASEVVLENCDYVTASNDDDGVALALEAFVFLDETAVTQVNVLTGRLARSGRSMEGG